MRANDVAREHNKENDQSSGVSGMPNFSAMRAARAQP